MVLRAILYWLPLPFIGTFNGILRVGVYGRFMSELTAHQISTFTGILLFGCYVWFLSRRWKVGAAGEAVAIGVIWLALTVCFEFVFGHYVFGNTWERLISDYNLFEGRLWILVLIWTTAVPYVMYKLRSR